LTEVKKDWPVWALGPPDLVVNLPKFEVPATGIIPYQMWTVDNPLDHDVWVRAVDFLPGARQLQPYLPTTRREVRRIGGTACGQS